MRDWSDVAGRREPGCWPTPAPPDSRAEADLHPFPSSAANLSNCLGTSDDGND